MFAHRSHQCQGYELKPIECPEDAEARGVRAGDERRGSPLRKIARSLCMLLRSSAMRPAAATLVAMICSLTIAPSASHAQTTTFAGAVKQNGNFFVLKDVGSGVVQVHEWEDSTNSWRMRGANPPSTYYSITSADYSTPSALTPSGGFHTSLWYGHGLGSYGVIVHWEPPNSPTPWTWAGNAWIGGTCRPSDLVQGKYMYTISAGGTRIQRSTSIRWPNSGIDDPNSFFKGVQPAVGGGSAFAPSFGGHAMTGSFSDSTATWSWTNLGTPPGTVALDLGAWMPQSNTIFARGANGNLSANYDWMGNRAWYDFGRPFGYAVESKPVSYADSRVFVVGAYYTNGVPTRALFQLYYNGTAWVWARHGWPTGTTLEPDVATASGVAGSRAIVKDTTGNFHTLYWGSNGWTWKSLGKP